MKKYLLGFISGLMICGITGVLAANYLYHADEVSYTPSNTNWNVDSVDAAIDELYNRISDANSALLNLKNTDIAKAVGVNGDTLESVINQLGTIVNQGDKSFTISGTNGITIPAGYYNGQGTIKTSGLIPTPTATKNITSNGNNIDVANYAKVNVNVGMGGIVTAAGMRNFQASCTASKSGTAYIGWGVRQDPWDCYLQVLVNGVQVIYQKLKIIGSYDNAQLYWGTVSVNVSAGQSIVAKIIGNTDDYGGGITIIYP